MPRGRVQWLKGFGSFFKVTGLLSGNIYIIPDGEGFTLIDCGGPPDFLLVSRAVKRLGYPEKTASRIIITHFHIDHAGCAARLKRLYGSQILAHELEAPILEGREHIETVYPKGVIGKSVSLLPGVAKTIGKVEPVLVDRTFRDGETLPLAGGLEVIHAPGHTPGSSCLYSRELGALFSGDAIINTFRFPTLPTEGFSCDFDEARKSALRVIERLERAELLFLCPGHGPVIKGPAPRLRSFRNRETKAVDAVSEKR